MTWKGPTERIVKDIRRRTRTQHSSEEKVLVVLGRAPEVLRTRDLEPGSEVTASQLPLGRKALGNFGHRGK